jgi:two-component system sensor histidine kinase KdpD
MISDRPNPDQLLARLKEEEAKATRGKLKIFFGAAPGVGKTYAMLEAGRKLVKEGLDVVVGYVEPHARPETQALVLGLDVLERRAVEYKGRTLWEFNLEAALARRPQLLLVDELAHTNAPGSTHAKRWQDVEELLAAGIDVYSTLNVQHLETLNDVVAQVTSVAVRETVPDEIFERADEIELVDLAPDDLIERLKEGKVYLPDQAHRAIENYFRKGNLIALRELALRKTAERVGDQALSYRQQHDVSKIWPTSERLLVCVGSSPMSARLVRATRRMAVGLRAPWTALHVDIAGARVPSPDDCQRLEQNLRLAEQLGAKVASVSGGDFADAVINYARENNITKILVGKPQFSRWREWFRGAYVYDLIRNCGDIDIYVISGEEEELPRRVLAPPTAQQAWLPYMWASLGVAFCTLLCFLLSEFLAATNLAMIYFASVVAISLRWGRWPSILSAVLSVAAFDVFFVQPFGTLAVSDTQYLFTFAVMLLIGLIVSELTARVRAQADAARNRERRTAALYEMSRELSGLPTREAVAQTARRLIKTALDIDAWVVVPSGESTLVSADPTPEHPLPSKDQGVIKWVYEHRQAAGFGTDTLPGSDGLYLPLAVPGGIVGVLGGRPPHEHAPLDTYQVQLLKAFAGQLSVAIERCNLALEAERIRLQVETERLRNSLLSAVSHDLRTPLATITGSASTLVENQEQLSSIDRHELAESILGESERLNRLVGNLLDMTRLDAGAVTLHREMQPIEEVVGVVLHRLQRDLRQHRVETCVSNQLPPVPIDATLIQQVLVNLLDNAAKFSPPGTTIDISVEQTEGDLVVRVADRGPGLPPGHESQIFEKFFRGDGQARSGSGIGLAICRAIVTLHGGKIRAGNRKEGGAVFEFTLPIHPLERETK